ncbi:MAG: hypothetical protein ACOC9T_02700 [Myxococcota bacterium]
MPEGIKLDLPRHVTGAFRAQLPPMQDVLHQLLGGNLSTAIGGEEWSVMHRQMLQVGAGHESWAQIKQVALGFEVGEIVGPHIAKMAALDRSLAGILSPSLHELCSQHLKEITLPALSTLSWDWPYPAGVLFELPTPATGASITWLAQYRGEPRLATSILADEGATADTEIELVELVCALCGGSMPCVDRSLKMHGRKKGILRLKIFPVCVPCFEIEKEQEGYLLEQLSALMGQASPGRPPLRVVKGEGQGDGQPRARPLLRLVESDPAEE